jgi:hypothetical protein
LEENLRAEQSSSFVASGGGEDAFGCNLKFLGEEWEFARLIFSEEDSTVFPGEKELVGFWYDRDNRYSESEEDLGRPWEEPLFEIL